MIPDINTDIEDATLDIKSSRAGIITSDKIDSNRNETFLTIR